MVCCLEALVGGLVGWWLGGGVGERVVQALPNPRGGPHPHGHAAPDPPPGQ